MNKFLLVFGLLFFIFSAFFFSPMFLMGVILMPLGIQVWIAMLLPVVFGSAVKDSYTRE